MMSDVRQGFLGAFGDFAEQESVKTNHLYCLSLFFIQRSQRLLNDTRPFWKSQSSPRDVRAIGFGDLNLGGLATVIEVPQRQILSAAQTSMVGVLEYPRSRAAFGWVELV